MKALLIGLTFFLAVFGAGCKLDVQERDGAVKAIQALPNYQELVIYFSLDDGAVLFPRLEARVYNFLPPETIRNTDSSAQHAAIFRGKDNALWLVMLHKNYEVSYLKKLS